MSICHFRQGGKPSYIALKIFSPGVAQDSTIAIASSTSTATNREHPGSCIVTPIN